MDKALEDKIEELKKEAIEKQIYEKANLIAKSLGWSYCISRASLDEMIYGCGKDTYSAPQFEDKKFKIRSGNSTSIIYEGKEVYSGAYVHENLRCIKCYIPGGWEKEFEELYIQAQAKSEETKRNKMKDAVEKVKRGEAQEEEALKSRFGLTKEV